MSSPFLEVSLLANVNDATLIFYLSTRQKLFSSKLSGSKFEGSDYLDDLTEIFEMKTKRKFTGTEAKQIIKFAGSGDSDPKVGVQQARITLDG